jgi:hypothetical protein
MARVYPDTDLTVPGHWSKAAVEAFNDALTEKLEGYTLPSISIDTMPPTVEKHFCSADG